MIVTFPALAGRNTSGLGYDVVAPPTGPRLENSEHGQCTDACRPRLDDAGYTGKLYRLVRIGLGNHTPTCCCSLRRRWQCVEGMDSGADDYITTVRQARAKVRLRAGTRIVDLQEQLVTTRKRFVYRLREIT
jgi:hypothetical protein